MLIITRREGEAIFIGDDIKVTVGEFNDREVRLAITAPREVEVLRREVAARATRPEP
jgi:carbon storage regulator